MIIEERDALEEGDVEDDITGLDRLSSMLFLLNDELTVRVARQLREG